MIFIECTTLTRNLALLVKKGWVRAERGEDGRSRKVSITARGREAALKALPAWRRMQGVLATALGPKRIAALMTSLDALTRA
jgi:DNA-binding MarR family transcriptional regulator